MPGGGSYINSCNKHVSHSNELQTRYTGFFPDSRFPTPDSRFPTPDSRLPTP
ncbi:MAG: hypothetical protein F6K55_29680 [Moorea sp. SIO4A3]|nr:hypothetical protein [Moorena sp. SIO4A3]